jgi:hypothetical protein
MRLILTRFNQSAIRIALPAGSVAFINVCGIRLASKVLVTANREFLTVK